MKKSIYCVVISSLMVSVTIHSMYIPVRRTTGAIRPTYQVPRTAPTAPHRYSSTGPQESTEKSEGSTVMPKFFTLEQISSGDRLRPKPEKAFTDWGALKTSEEIIELREAKKALEQGVINAKEYLRDLEKRGIKKEMVLTIATVLEMVEHLEETEIKAMNKVLEEYEKSQARLQLLEEKVRLSE